MSLREKKKYNPDLIDSDREMLENFYNALGYLSWKLTISRRVYEEGGKDNVNYYCRYNMKAQKTEIGRHSYNRCKPCFGNGVVER